MIGLARAIHDRLSKCTLARLPSVPVAERCQLTQQQLEAAFEQGAALLEQTSVLWMAALSSGMVVTSEVSGSCKNLFMSFCEWYPGTLKRKGWKFAISQRDTEEGRRSHSKWAAPVSSESVMR